MSATSLGTSLGLAALATFIFWAVGNAVGVDIALFASLALALGLTLIANILIATFRGRRDGW